MGETRRRGVADSVPYRAVRVPGEQQQGLCGIGGTYGPTARGSAPVHVVVDIYYDRSIEKNNEGRGWIVKTPFTTNGHNKRYAHSVEDIICKIAKQYETLKEILPYTMVQATMANKKEYKVVLFKGEARYISKASTNKKGIAFSSKPELMDFAMEALKEFASVCPNALVDFKQ